tara:strand:- start:1302 stop:1661 length:360 start_codon:yes stop_codon:yes gene_type:complete
MEKNLSGSIDSEKESRSVDLLKDALNSVDPEFLPHGIVMFHKDGSLSSLCAPEEIIGPDEAATVTLALDFTRYAFDRPDWMLEYVNMLDKALKKSRATKSTKPHLTLIKGGLEEDEQKN